MKEKKEEMTIEEHLEMASDLLAAGYYLNKVFFNAQQYNNKSSPLMKALRDLHPNMNGSKFSLVKSELDSQYHEVATKEDFLKYGHIYYLGSKKPKDDDLIDISNNSSLADKIFALETNNKKLVEELKHKKEYDQQDIQEKVYEVFNAIEPQLKQVIINVLMD